MPEETLSVKIKLMDFASRGMKKFVGVVDRSVKKVRAKLMAVKSAIFSLKGAFLMLGGTLIAKSFIDAGAELEKFRTQLVAVMDQNEELADSTLKWVREFAKVTPHMTNDVIQAFVSLQAAGVTANEQMMDTIGNVAYVFDRNIADVSLGLVSMEKEIFKRLGVQWEIVGQKAKIWSGDTIVHTDKAAKSMRKGILEIWEKKFPGAMKKAEGDYKGMTALLASEWWEFRAKVMKAGVMDFIKAGLKAAGQRMGDLGASAPKVADKIVDAMRLGAQAIGMIADGAKVAMIAVMWLGKETLKAFESQEQKAKRVADKAVEGSRDRWGRIIKIQRGAMDSVALMEAEIEDMREGSYQAMVKAWLKQIDINIAKREGVAIAKEAHGLATLNDEAARGLVATWKDANTGFKGAITPLTDLNKALKEAHDIELAVLAEQAKLIKEAEQADLDAKLSAAQKRFESIRGAAMQIGSVLEDNILRAIDAAVEGTFRWRRALQDTLKDLGMTMAKMGISAGLQLAATGVAGALAAKGGVFPAFETRLPIRAYAKGGITQGPEIAIIGEGKKQEAVVPLDNGQKIPVEMKGDGGGATNIYITAMDGADVMRVLSNNPEAVAAGVQRARRDNPGFLGE